MVLVTGTREFHEDYGAVFDERGGREVVLEYGRGERTHQAVRNGVGVIEVPCGVVVVEGADRVEYVDNVITNRVPREDGHGEYAFLLDPQGRILTDMYVFNAGDRLLLFTPPGEASTIDEAWEVFIEDVTIRVVSESFRWFGVHGPSAEEKVQSVISGGLALPEDRLGFVRGEIGDAGVTVVRGDDLAGETGYAVIAESSEAFGALDALVNHGMNAVLFGLRTWEALTLEAGSPLYHTELAGNIPNVTGVRDAVDYEKGCFVGQEVVSKVANRGRPSNRLVGLVVEAVPASDAAVFEGDSSVGRVTRGCESPVLGEAVAFAYVKFGVESDADLAVRVGGEDVAARMVDLPFVSGSARSPRIPAYQ